MHEVIHVIHQKHDVICRWITEKNEQMFCENLMKISFF